MHSLEEINSNEVKWIGRSDCRHCALRKKTLLGALTTKELEELPAAIDQYEFPGGYTIYQAGDRCDDVFTIKEGFVKAIAKTEDGVNRIVRLYRPGDVFGLESLIQDSYQYTIETMGVVSSCKVPAKIIKRLVGKSAKLSEALMRQWQAGIERADYWLMRLTTGSVESRVKWLLKLLVDIEDANNNATIRLPSSIEMSAIVDTTVESVSRTMAKLKREKVLQRTRPHTYQCDLGKLSFNGDSE